MAPAEARGASGRDDPTRSTPDRPVVPGYEVGEPLGAGAVGSVWSGARLEDGVRVALKVVRGADAEAADRVARELRALGRAAGDHVVRVHEALTLPTGDLVLVLDLLEGGSLRSAVRARGHLSPGELVTVLSPVASGLGRLHAAGVVHGDVSPGNVLLDRTGRPVLADLGLATVVGDVVDEVGGTEGFVAPEVLAGALPGPAADVYAVGALGWFCLTGEVPGPAVLRGRLAEVDDLGAVPEALVGLVESCLDPDPGQRPSAADLALAVYDCAPAEPLPLVACGDEIGVLTHRIRRAAAAQQREADRQDRRPPWRRPRRRTATAGGRSGRAGAHRRAASRGPGRQDRHRPRGRRRGGRPRARGDARPARAAARRRRCRRPRARRGSRVGGQRSPGAGGRRERRRAGTVGTAGSGRQAGPGDLLVATRDAAATRPRELLAALAERRAAAWRSGTVGGLADLDAPGSPALSRDTTALAAAHREGLRYTGLSFAVVAAEVVSAGSAAATLRATVDTSAYLVDGGGRRTPRDAAPGEPLLYDLVWTGDGWRVDDVRADAPDGYDEPPRSTQPTAASMVP